MNPGNIDDSIVAIS